MAYTAIKPWTSPVSRASVVKPVFTFRRLRDDLFENEKAFGFTTLSLGSSSASLWSWLKKLSRQHPERPEQAIGDRV